MGIFKRLGKLLNPRSDSDQWVLWVSVECNRCGEQIRGRIDLRNDLSINYEEDGSLIYFTRKTLMGEGHCFQRIEVELNFDKDRKLMDRQISGGKFTAEPSA
jgi:hypothetical protein